MMNKNINVCNNCGKQGHMFHQCKLPITSYGIIAFRSSAEGLQFLMIRRKNSFGYIDFLRGKYSPHNLTQLNTIIDEMSLDEKNRIQTLPFEQLWNEMWGNMDNLSNQFKGEEISSKKKFELLKEGVQIDDKIYTLIDIFKLSNGKYLAHHHAHEMFMDFHECEMFKFIQKPDKSVRLQLKIAHTQDQSYVEQLAFQRWRNRFGEVPLIIEFVDDFKINPITGKFKNMEIE